MKQSNGMMASLTAAAMSIGMASRGDGERIEIKTMEGVHNIADSMGDFAQLMHAIRTPRALKVSPGQNRAAKMIADEHRRIMRGERGRYNAKAFPCPAKPNRSSHFHVIEMTA